MPDKSSEPKLSIIVPVYNSEQYLNQCVESILNQKFTDFELILVNDGSTDSSGDICNDFEIKDKRVKVIHKENGGVSSARALGFESSTGDYIGFVDSDDIIAPGMFEILVSLGIKNNADILCCEYQIFNDSNKTINRCNQSKLMRSKEIDLFLWNKIYNRNLFCLINYKQYKSDFPLWYFEDSFIVPQLILEAAKVIQIKQKLYFYRKRDGNLGSLKFGPYKEEALKAKKGSKPCSE